MDIARLRMILKLVLRSKKGIILTDINRTLYPNFTNDEIACRHCGIIKIDSRVMDGLQLARFFLQRPIVLTSACRCDKHNEAVGGSDTSYHRFNSVFTTLAVDIQAVTGAEMFELIIVLWLCGFRRFGLNWDKKFVHADMGTRGVNKIGMIFKY